MQLSCILEAFNLRCVNYEKNGSIFEELFKARNHMKTHYIQNTKTDDVHTEISLSPFGRFFRMFASWFGFTGLYAMFAVCPFCGRQGCPVGLASAGTIGAFLSLCTQDWKRLFIFIKRKISVKLFTK